MARKRDISFFTDIQSDEELEIFLEQTQLIVLDVYQGLFGPCTSVQSVLERKKISLDDSNSLQLATCNADKIEKLARFRNKSYPTILFCRNKKVIDISYGADIPQLLKLCTMHLEEKVPVNQIPSFEFDELLPFELKAIEQQLKEQEEERRRQREAELVEKCANLDKIIELMNKNSSDMGVTLFMPHVAKIAFRKTHETAKWLSLANRAEKMIKLEPDMMETLNYKLENPIDEKILERIYNEDIFAVLWYTDPRNPVTDVLKEFVRLVSEPQERFNEELEEIVWETILESLIIYPEEEGLSTTDVSSVITYRSSKIQEKELPKESNEKFENISAEEENERTMSETVEESGETIDDGEITSHQESYAEEQEDEEEQAIEINDGRITILPVWTPKNQSGNAIFMHTFFRSQFESFLPPVTEPDPPHLCMIFSAKVRKQVLEVCEEYAKDLLKYGFFEGEDFEDFSPICDSIESYEETLRSGKEKMILKVAKKSSLLSLELMKLSPLHISHNVTAGEMECAMLFNNNDEDEEGEEEYMEI